MLRFVVPEGVDRPRVTRLDVTESTNDDAKRGAREGAPHASVWIAESQTKGRGRQGRTWVSPRGENLLFSVLLRIACPPMRVPPLALVAGLAVRDAVARALGEDGRVKVKWPNDVLVDGKKVAGVLVESALSGGRVEYVVVGAGVNVQTRVFPHELADIATSISLAARADAPPPDREALLADILEGIHHDAKHVAHRGLGLVAARLAKHDALAGRRVAGDDVSGIAAGIAEDGRLRVSRNDGVIVTVASGEVRIC